MIQQTVLDLHESLGSIDEKLEALLAPGRQLSGEEDEERGQLAMEKESVQQCLQICAQISAHLDEVQPKVLGIASRMSQGPPHSADLAHVSFSAPQTTVNALNQCKVKLTETSARLQSHLQQLESRKLTSSHSGNKQIESSMWDEINAIRECLDFCSQASEVAQSDRINVFEDINIADDSHQAIVSTVGDLISARKVTAGSRSRQLLGQVSDESFQRFSSSQSDLIADQNIETSSGQPQFENKYGTGRNLKHLK